MRATREHELLTVTSESLLLTFWVGAEAPVRIVPAGGGSLNHELPGLVHVTTAGQGRDWASDRLVHSSIGGRLRYAEHRVQGDALCIAQRDDTTGLAIESWFRPLGSTSGAFRTWTVVTNHAQSPLTLETVTTFVADASGLAPGVPAQHLLLTSARMDWFGEGRWSTSTLQERGLVDLALGPQRGLPDPRGRLAEISSSSWSTGTSSPTAVLQSPDADASIVWQIEHNGPWRWELAQARDTAYLALSGPTFDDHHWTVRLEPGESFTSVTATVAWVDGGVDAAFGALTRARRAGRELTAHVVQAPLVYNDYMNTLDADPSIERVRPLVVAAAAVGAEYYCMDAGWYDAPGESWWDRVGEWEVDSARFPGGLQELKALTDAHGLGLGLWIEPEVVGLRSPLASRLPDEAFLCRGGERVVTQGRYHLDFSAPAARAHLDRQIDHLVNEMGVSYFKFDYNITPGSGGSGSGDSVGGGLLAHARAFVAWLNDLKRRHPGLLIENCASGGMRMDYAVLGVADVQSTSDQQDAIYYAPIAAAAPASVLPEQAGNWAYPQPSMSDDEIVFTMVNGLAGVLYLAGFIDRMTSEQRQLVAAGAAHFLRHRAEVAVSVPSWPLGIAQSAVGWNCLRIGRFLYIWKHPGAEATVSVPLAGTDDRDVEQLYPPLGVGATWTTRVDPAENGLELSVEVDTVAAAVFVIGAAEDAGAARP